MRNSACLVPAHQHWLAELAELVRSVLLLSHLFDAVVAGRSHVAPLVEEMLQRLNSEVNRYDRVITFWHQFGPDLEAAVCTVLRETTAAVTRQCGLVAVVCLWPKSMHLFTSMTLHRSAR